MTEKPLPSRKHTRLRNFDYSSNGYYYVTVCTKGKKCIFGKLVRDNGISGNTLAINERQYYGAVMRLSEYGLIAEKQLLTLEEKYGFLTIDKYVIMPNHIHIIFILDGNTAGASPRPTLSDILCVYKSLTVRECHKFSGKTGSDIFQSSFYERVIRDEISYFNIWKYIEENPIYWVADEYFNNITEE